MGSWVQILWRQLSPAARRAPSTQWRRQIEALNRQVRERHFEQVDPSLEAMRQWLEAQPEDRSEASAFYQELGELYQNLGGNNRQAEACFGRACDAAERCFGPQSLELAVATNTLSVFLIQQRRYDEASGLLERLLPLVEAHLGPEHAEVATCLENLAAVLRHQGEAEEAARLRNRAIEIRRATRRDGLSAAEG